MIMIKDKANCCGCGACAQKCPKGCISLVEDSEGFLYPTIAPNKCIDCGICEKVCHELHPYEEREPINVYAAINRNEEIRLKSSSGGIFYLLAEKTINESGVVFGARFNKNWQVVIDYTENIKGVISFMGSKYVQSRTENTYKEAEKFLKSGRKVLYSGTPCQIAGLKHFLRKEYDNLVTVDFVCHGVPSPKVWSLYLKEIVTKLRNIKKIEFRNKHFGWKNFNFKISDDTTTLLSDHMENHYMKAFLSDIILRPSCYGCKAKQGKSHSDITIADFWGVGNEIPEMDDDKGTGLVIVNTYKGKSMLNLDDILYHETSLSVASRYNPGLNSSIIVPKQRNYFFSKLDKANSIIRLIEKCFQPSVKQQMIHRMKMYKHEVKMYIKNIMGGGKS